MEENSKTLNKNYQNIFTLTKDLNFFSQPYGVRVKEKMEESEKVYKNVCERVRVKKMVAFTLAEVLITLVVIGVVAAITMPILLSEVSERVNSNRQANIVQKVTKAVELMIVNGDYEGFQTTDEFVDKLQKYLKISRRCRYDELNKCWPTDVITKADGTKMNVSEATTGRKLHTNNDTNNVGLVLADGASIILTYNPEAPVPSAENGFTATKKSLPIGNGNKKEFAYTSNATGAIDFVMDVNGATGPNAETDNDENYHDIRSFKIASFSTAGCPGYKFNGVCVYDIGTDYTPVACTETSKDKYCETVTGLIADHWAGANKACQELGMKLPSATDLSQINSEFNSKRTQHTGMYHYKGYPWGGHGGYAWGYDYDANAPGMSGGAGSHMKVICISK